jgi:TolB-like protein
VAVTLAWYHGDRGLRHVSGAELAIIALLMLLGAGFLWLFVRPSTEHVAEQAPAASAQPVTAAPASAPAPQAATKPRIAILPFENLSPDPANAFFADGLQEDIISTLATRAPGLEVISRTTMMLYRKAPKPIEQVASELGASHVIEGSVRREGNRVRLTLQLIDGRNDNHLWAQTYDRTLKDALTLQSDVAAEVASQLAVQLAGGAQAGKPPTTDPEAYDLYLKARLIRKQLNPVSLMADVERMNTLFARAIARDPNFGAAYVERANHALSDYLANVTTSEERLTLARADLDAAERLVPGNTILKATELLYRHTMETDEAVAPIIEVTKQGGVDPLNLFFLNVALVQAGRLTDALALLERWAQLDPANITILALYASELEIARRPKEALRIYEQISARSDTDFYAVRRAGVLFAFTGKIEDMRKAIDRQASLANPNLTLVDEFDALRFEHRYGDLKRLLDGALFDSVGPWFDKKFHVGFGRVPVSEMRGWTALLLGDAQSGAAEARALAAFVAAAPKLPTNGSYLRSLSAEAQLFSGDKPAAIAAARKSLALAPRSRDMLAWRAAAASAAAVFAWAGAPDEAMDLLEQLATVEAGLGPAEITRDPLYAVPLADNARYKALSKKLEAQMAATKLE